MGDIHVHIHIHTPPAPTQSTETATTASINTGSEMNQGQNNNVETQIERIEKAVTSTNGLIIKSSGLYDTLINFLSKICS